MPDLTGQLPYRRPRCSSPCPCAVTLQAAVQVRDLEHFQVDHQVTVVIHPGRVRWKLISLCFLASQWASLLVHPPLVEATRTASRLHPFLSTKDGRRSFPLPTAMPLFARRATLRPMVLLAACPGSCMFDSRPPLLRSVLFPPLSIYRGTF